ncbi:phosphoribosylformylglycinamidine synthase subunit PurS [Vulcanisaeta sp. JCM 16159]|uniref:phosphoribosylformylglycinamidine synthase subunit PurS n=1 Tax=Vulcanisaeta sp. JCM 16159 TaxID=1295371 RepID=UPI0006D05F87|nr:phosphoribosylformylglycinamidine synthase subunit PurS [Vulcanisaeta sp. JCM 16159]
MSNVSNKYLVHTAIVLKGVRDPEGETILKDLVSISGFSNVNKVISGKYLGFIVDAKDGAEAVDYVREVCEKARIFNPTVHRLLILGVENA